MQKNKNFTDEFQQFLLPQSYHACLIWLNWKNINFYKTNHTCKKPSQHQKF